MTNKRLITLALTIVWFVLLFPFWAAAFDANRLVEDSFNYVRGKASVATVAMTIVRPSWQRKMTMKAWTRGQKDSLFYIDSPPKDHGNGTLKKGREMWLFNPKINQLPFDTIANRPPFIFGNQFAPVDTPTDIFTPIFNQRSHQRLE